MNVFFDTTRPRFILFVKALLQVHSQCLLQATARLLPTYFASPAHSLTTLTEAVAASNTVMSFHHTQEIRSRKNKTQLPLLPIRSALSVAITGLFGGWNINTVLHFVCKHMITCRFFSIDSSHPERRQNNTATSPAVAPSHRCKLAGPLGRHSLQRNFMFRRITRWRRPF